MKNGKPQSYSLGKRTAQNHEKLRQQFGITKTEYSFLKKLSTPIKIQNFLDTLPVNLNKAGEAAPTYMSPRRVLREGKAHCFEGSLFAALALWIQGRPALVLDLKSMNGDDHTVALYQENGYWGAISKTNHATLRFRDPVYENVRELALSFFHEYIHLKTGQKILRSYSEPFDLKNNLKKMRGKIKKGERGERGKDETDFSWITSEEDLDNLADALDTSPHHAFIPKKNLKFLRPGDAMELIGGNLVEWTPAGKKVKYKK